IKLSDLKIFIAGTNTSAATIIWVMSFLMMKNSIAIKKVQEEVRKGTKGFVNVYAIQSLHYLKVIVKETMKSFWDNGQEFNPDTFTGHSVDLKGKDFELILFGVGPSIAFTC
ncbi:p450 domain-containing protein, partial [Cephalotus follicularis]